MKTPVISLSHSLDHTHPHTPQKTALRAIKEDTLAKAQAAGYKSKTAEATKRVAKLTAAMEALGQELKERRARASAALKAQEKGRVELRKAELAKSKGIEVAKEAEKALGALEEGKKEVVAEIEAVEVAMQEKKNVNAGLEAEVRECGKAAGRATEAADKARQQASKVVEDAEVTAGVCLVFGCCLVCVFFFSFFKKSWLMIDPFSYITTERQRPQMPRQRRSWRRRRGRWRACKRSGRRSSAGSRAPTRCILFMCVYMCVY